MLLDQLSGAMPVSGQQGTRVVGRVQVRLHIHETGVHSQPLPPTCLPVRRAKFQAGPEGLHRVTPSTPGSTHDLKHVVEAQVIEQVPKEVAIIGDAGFGGLQNYYPERRIGTPHKARRNHPLNPDQKLANREFSSVRIVVENTLSHMKHFRVLAHQFRHTVALYDDAFRAVVGIINDRIDRRLNLSIAA